MKKTNRKSKILTIILGGNKNIVGNNNQPSVMLIVLIIVIFLSLVAIFTSKDIKLKFQDIEIEASQPEDKKESN